MEFLSERITRIGPLIWAFPGGLALLFALYFALRPRGSGKRPDPPPPDPNAQMSLAPTGSQIGCVWTLAGVWITLWLFLFLRS